MNEAVKVFLTGSFGVFLGMAFLYLSVKLTGAAVSALQSRKKASVDTGKGA